MLFAFTWFELYEVDHTSQNPNRIPAAHAAIASVTAVRSLAVPVAGQV
jgi:hypothetical protein